MRTYHVLHGMGRDWVHAETIEAANPLAAIRAVALDQHPTDATSWLAIPDRNWTQVDVSIEQPEPRLRLTVIPKDKAQLPVEPAALSF